MPKSIGLDDPEYVARLKETWGKSVPIEMSVVEFAGSGDPFFGGAADDRPLGRNGCILDRRASPFDVAVFKTIDDAHQAATAIKNRRPDSLLGVLPRWR
jgi:hypothetical protein